MRGVTSLSTAELALIGQADREINVSPEDMAFIREKLTSAEVSRRKGGVLHGWEPSLSLSPTRAFSGETRSVFACFNALSDYYLNISDCKTAIYFLEKCLDIAKVTGDAKAEMVSVPPSF